MFANTGPFSYSPRRVFQQDDLMGAPLQRNNISRPSGKAIYMQRKEYSESLNRQPDHFQVRVEHLFTCELDSEEMRTVDNCVTKLKSLDARGRLWPQEMIMEVQGGYLLLSDIETKVELESLPLSCIMQSKAVLDSCTYNSLLAVTVHERSKRFPQVLMFQCEEIGAELIKSDLDKAVQKGGVGVEPRRDQSDIRRNLENIIGQHASGGFQQAGPRPVQRERTPPLLDHPPPRWGSREPEVTVPHPDPHELWRNPEVTSQQAEDLRNTDIFNHVINDLEIFLDKVSAAVNAPLPQEDKRKKKKAFQKNKPKINGPADSMPPWEEYISCLQKIKYGLNLLSQLDGTLTNPTAPDYVHIFFSSLGMIVPQYPAHLPPTVLSPMLTESALQLLSQVVGPEEELLWRSLGDSWNIPRSRWTGNDVPPYNPEFYNGWQPPTPLPYQNGPMNRSNSQHLPSGRQGGQSESQSYLPRGIQQQPEEPVTQSPWSSPQSTRSSEAPVYMQVIYDYMARNNQELSVLKGDVVEVIQKSRQWCLVRNTSNEEGNVPRSVLEPIENTRPMENQKIRGPVTLDISSTPAAVRAWLEYKGFSKITVNTLGVLSGKLLLGMTKDEIRTVCPEEGGKVFFQLQAVKSAIALASEPSALYNGRY
ncbi:epidermal growth factor receptor kinase substrate 8-like protein 3b [Mastacembelus armatus]|uniref:epidermal growth factor receptor kinase substrate 8-like protein 3b n=1 Tax=Mastacembelus armatus TaxID=205130 RepID=UPI000E456562|nr:epidermal growth factor receptor kinase substrate 8-like protein 3 [Mastacembelus armatus]